MDVFTHRIKYYQNLLVSKVSFFSLKQYFLYIRNPFEFRMSFVACSTVVNNDRFSCLYSQVDTGYVSFKY